VNDRVISSSFLFFRFGWKRAPQTGRRCYDGGLEGTAFLGTELPIHLCQKVSGALPFLSACKIPRW
jgi:hypothetical protein